MRYTVVRQKFKPHLALWTTTVFNEHDCWIVFFRRLLLMDRGFQLLLDNLTSTLFEAYFYYPDVTSWKYFCWNASRHELTKIIQMIWALLTFEKSVLISDWIKGILIVLFVSQITHGTTYRVERFKHNHVACSNASCGCPNFTLFIVVISASCVKLQLYEWFCPKQIAHMKAKCTIILCGTVETNWKGKRTLLMERQRR